jgi:NAD-dependent deacetylase
MNNMQEAVQLLARLIKTSRKTLALTGAGASTASGIPDYRSKDTGLWARFDPLSQASVTALLSRPADFYDFNLPLWSNYITAAPNPIHQVLAAMEAAGMLQGIITQNIDGLHRKAGSQNVWEVHGHLRTCHCTGCRQSYPFAELTRQFEQRSNPPRCPSCFNLLRPDVVLFEDAMSDDYYRALEAMKGCQLLLVVGSSLQVYPVADMPGYAQRLAIINKEPTPWDDRAELVYHGQAEEFFAGLAGALGVKE